MEVGRRGFLRGALGAAAAVTLRPGAARARAAAAARRCAVVPERSEVRYRVREQLVGLNFPNDAVGATRAIEGAVALDATGRLVAGASRFTVDVRTLRSDEPRRDSYVRRNTLETDRYPAIVFVPRELGGLQWPPAAAAPFRVVGDLTIRDVTRVTTWEATATAMDGGRVGVRASTAFRFSEFDLRTPRVSVVLGVDETIRLEADLVLRPAA